MGRLEDEVRELILESNRSLAAFARKIGLPEHTLYSALNNGLAGATLTTVLPILMELNLDVFEFAKGRIVPVVDDTKSVLVPVYGSISAGIPIESATADDLFPIPVELHATYPNAFMLRVEGTSMNRVLPDGCFALVNPCSDVAASGEMYAVAVGSETATVKHVRKLANGLELRPDSDDPTHHPLVFDHADENAPEVRIIGRIVWWCPPLS